MIVKTCCISAAGTFSPKSLAAENTRVIFATSLTLGATSLYEIAASFPL